MTTAYPLSWPEGFPRHRLGREAGRFKTSLSVALNNVRNSLRLFGQDSGKPISELVISSNVTLGATSPQDAGVAVWFRWEGMQICIPVDRYSSVAANLQAIHHIVEARRVELRHGTLALVRATFSGFKALPTLDWRNVLNVASNATLDQAEQSFRSLAMKAHPDRGGTQDRMALLNAALTAARAELRRN